MDTPQIGVTGIIRAGVQVITSLVPLAHASSFPITEFIHGAGIAVVTRPGGRAGRAPGGGIAALGGARVAIVTVLDHASACTSSAYVALGTWVAIVTDLRVRRLDAVARQRVTG